MAVTYTYGFWFYHELLPFISHGNDSSIGRIRTHNCSYWVTRSSSRLRLFKRSPQCTGCYLKGQIWLLQSQGRLESDGMAHRPHLNLYAVNKNDNLVLMTQDHIFPKSKGGRSTQDNLQTMCTGCNQAKADKVYDGHSYRDSRDVDERSFRQQRLRTLRQYADLLAATEKRGLCP